MTKSSHITMSAFLPALALTTLALGACSTTTTVEAPRPAAVTVIAPSPTPWVAPAMAAPPAANMGDVAAVASRSGNFNTLLAAVNAAGLASTLTATGPITVFAPTDQAFAKLPAGTLDKLLRMENRDALRKILSYHIIAGKVMSSGLMGKTLSSPTMEGQSVAIDGRNGVRVNGASVIQADIEANNGLIHAIDTVLMPSDMPMLR